MAEPAMEDRWAIQETYARFEQAVADKDYTTMASIFTDDADIENRWGTGNGKGQAAVEQRFIDRFDDAPATKIVACNHLIDVEGDTAHSTVDYLVLEVDLDSPSGLTVRQMGRYHDDWRKEDGTWRIYNRWVKDMNPTLQPAS